VAGSSLAQGAERGHKLKAIDSLRLHWPDYLMEAGGLSIYMFSVCAFATLSWHPASPIRQFIDGAIPRRAVMGLGIGTALIAVVVSPWGRRSGGHLNPAMTLAFYRLGKLELWDMLFYAGSQFLGALAGVAVAAHVLRGALGNTAVHYAVTAPGVYGDIVAFVAEVMISFVLMSTILFVSEHEHLARYTPYFAGALVAICFVFEAPLSGNSANPARSFASAMFAATGMLFGSISLHRRSGCWLQLRPSCSSVLALVHFAPSCITPIINVVCFIMDIEQCFGFSGRPLQLQRRNSMREPSAERMS
jgi:aquaporin Z